MVALYFSVYTLTSVGFGDVSAYNMFEFYVCTVMMIFGSVFWAYVIGNFCSIIATADRFGIEFRQRMDELNIMMGERHFDGSLKQRCRMFYMKARRRRCRRRASPSVAVGRWSSAPLSFVVAPPSDGRARTARPC